jgi:hypothetical protein
LAVAAVRSPELFVELAQKVKALKDQVEVWGKENIRLVEVLNCEIETNHSLRESIGKLVALFESVTLQPTREKSVFRKEGIVYVR